MARPPPLRREAAASIVREILRERLPLARRSGSNPPSVSHARAACTGDPDGGRGLDADVPEPRASSEIVEATARELPDAELRVLDGIGHYPTFEAPEEVATLLVEFLARKGIRGKG